MAIAALVGLMLFAASAAATGTLIRLLQRRAVMDHPNERSSHVVPTPRGGGIAVVGTLAVAWFLWAYGHQAAPDGSVLVFVCAILLAAVSFVDDLRGLPAAARLLVQVAAVAAVLAVAPPTTPVFQGLLPAALDSVAVGLLWLWFVNLYNFMDGIDGIAGVETIALGLGVAAVAAVAGIFGDVGVPGVLLAAAAAGFLCWNWQPARIFLGDVGSIPVGLLAGWLLLQVADVGHWAAALILPAYYLSDASITLARRAMRGERVWQAHREHFYQRAVQGGRRHATVCAAVAVANLALAVLAVASVVVAGVAASLLCLLGAAAVVVLLIRWMSR